MACGIARRGNAYKTRVKEDNRHLTERQDRMPPQCFSQDSINILQRRSVGPHWQPRSSHSDIDNTLRFLLDFRKENHCKNEYLERRRCLHKTWITNSYVGHWVTHSLRCSCKIRNVKIKQYTPYSGMLLTSKSSCRGFLDRLKQVCFFIRPIGSHSMQRVGNH